VDTGIASTYTAAYRNKAVSQATRLHASNHPRNHHLQLSGNNAFFVDQNWIKKGLSRPV